MFLMHRVEIEGSGGRARKEGRRWQDNLVLGKHHQTTCGASEEEMRMRVEEDRQESQAYPSRQ
jgi:hypothetical protein